MGGLDYHLLAWTLDYLTNRPHYVRLQDFVSQTAVYNAGFQHCSSSPSTQQTSRYDLFDIQMFSDDSAIVECLENNKERV